MSEKVMKNVVVHRKTKTSSAAAIAFIPILIVLFTAPHWGSRGTISMLVEFFFYLGVSQMWNLLVGYGGVASLGQHAYIGFGGYMLFLLTMVYNMNPLLALVVAGVLTAIISIPVAAIAFRLQGAYLAIGTWVIAEIFRLVFYKVKILGGGSGCSLPVEVAKSIDFEWLSRDGVLYLAALILCVLVNYGAYALLCTRGGLGLKAVRDNEGAARSCGIDNWKMKLIVYVAAALGTGLMGALIYLSQFYISPTAAFDINWTSYMMFIVVIGGLGTLEGPIIGTIVFFILREFLSSLGSWYLIILGALAIVIMLKMPEGIWGALGMRFDIHVFPTRRRLVLEQSESGD